MTFGEVPHPRSMGKDMEKNAYSLMSKRHGAITKNCLGKNPNRGGGRITSALSAVVETLFGRGMESRKRHPFMGLFNLP